MENNIIVGITLANKKTKWERLNEDGVVESFPKDYFDQHPIYSGIVDEVIDGQKMVRVPKFYYRSDTTLGDKKKVIFISDQPSPGFSVHPAFMNYGVEIDQFWVGKYQGTPDGGKLGSTAGLLPLVSINLPTMQSRAASRNINGITGFALWNIYQLGAIQMLALIEMGGSDSQTIIGQGNVNGSSALAVDHPIVAQATWRGIVGLWGNVFQMVDGLQTDASGSYIIWDNLGCKSYTSTGLKVPATGWMHRRSGKRGDGFDLGAVFLAKKTRTTLCDSSFSSCLFSPKYNRVAVAYHGGYWDHLADSGLFCLNVMDTASWAIEYVAGRLAKV